MKHEGIVFVMMNYVPVTVKVYIGWIKCEWPVSCVVQIFSKVIAVPGLMCMSGHCPTQLNFPFLIGSAGKT